MQCLRSQVRSQIDFTLGNKRMQKLFHHVYRAELQLYENLKGRGAMKYCTVVWFNIMKWCVKTLKQQDSFTIYWNAVSFQKKNPEWGTNSIDPYLQLRSDLKNQIYFCFPRPLKCLYSKVVFYGVLYLHSWSWDLLFLLQFMAEFWAKPLESCYINTFAIIFNNHWKRFTLLFFHLSIHAVQFYLPYPSFTHTPTGVE